MFALAFSFPAGRYHATPWGRNVNEADIAWPPEPWRLLRTLIAAYWRKGDHSRWSQNDLAVLIDALAETLPEYSLPTGAIHSHTRHYMPSGVKKGRPKTSLVFDAFVKLPRDSVLVAVWPQVTLEPQYFALATHLVDSVGYLGRAESWTQCEALAEWNGTLNCRPLDGEPLGDTVRLLASHSQSDYSAERRQIMADMKNQLMAGGTRRLSQRRLDSKLDKELRSNEHHAHTLPERLVDALALDTADYQDRGWSRPPAAREVTYTLTPDATVGVVSRVSIRRQDVRARSDLPTVARFLLAGRPSPRIEDTIRIGELMRRAALAQFGWRNDEADNRRIPNAPSEISGRAADGRPLKDPHHSHAFWLPEDADGDGLIDHVSVFIANGMNPAVQSALDRLTRLWLPPSKQRDDFGAEPIVTKEWRLALEGFGRPADFPARIFATSRHWQSTTPFLASGHLKGFGYSGEVLRLLKRRGLNINGVDVSVLPNIDIGGAERRALHFHRVRSRGREARPDRIGAMLEITLDEAIEGPLAIGYGSHFGLGLFVAVEGD